jgi:flagellar hook-basal body complex protein FliE
MSIPAIGAIGAMGTTAGVSAVTGPTAPVTSAASGSAGVNAAPGGGFGAALANGLDQLQQMQSNADSLAVQAATGDLTDVHDYTIASTEASLATQLTVAVRDKALEAFNSIMQMPV